MPHFATFCENPETNAPSSIQALTLCHGNLSKSLLLATKQYMYTYMYMDPTYS
jgi:hypothetical protein